MSKRFTSCFIGMLVISGYFNFLSAATCIEGDLDGNGRVEINDLLLFVDQWLDPSGCIGHEDDCADLIVGDGVDTADFSILAGNWLKQCPPNIVINEIHYDPDIRVELVEFVELHNAGSFDVDLSGWYFSDGLDYIFEQGVVLPSGGFIVVAANRSHLISKYETSSGLVYGPFVGKLNNQGEDIELRNAVGETIDTVDYGMGFPWPTVGYVATELDEGDGNSIQLINPELDNDLGGHWRSSFPTPAAVNGVLASDTAPAIRQVKHSPECPTTADPVTITAKVTDPGGVKTVSLSYQFVIPGSFIPAYLPLPHSILLSAPDTPFTPNPDFEHPANWTTITMVDDGKGQDEYAGDDIYTATLSMQMLNRSIVRYRITVEDDQNNSIRVPYLDDPSLNFACYIYDGVPDYVAETRSVSLDGAGHVYSSDIMTSLPVYSLLARAEDIIECVAYDSADQVSGTAPRSKFNWEGAFVYDGKVYDHVMYRLRGFNQRYSGVGKRAWRVRFMRGNYLEARDNFGKKYPENWRTINISKGCDHLLGHGNFGLNEKMNAELFNMVGVPSPEMNAFHFRVVDGAEEVPTGINGQYYGDFWGMFFGVEDYDARFINAHDLPEGNLYKLKAYTYDGNLVKRFQGINSVTDDSDFQNIRHNCDPYQTNEWLESHVDVEHWYRYNTICEMVIHRDYNPCDSHLKNRAWFFESVPGSTYGRMKVLPHDTDSSWLGGFTWDGNGDYPEETIYADHPGNDTPGYGFYYEGTWPPKEDLKLQHRNVMREFRDLLWTEEQINPLLDDMAAIIADFSSADRDRWKDAPADAGSQDWGSMESRVAEMKAFAFGPGSNEEDIDNEFVNAEGDDVSVPDTPVITYTGPAEYPANSLTFETTPFTDPQGNETFEAMKWRIAEVEPAVAAGPEPGEVELVPTGAEWSYFKGTQEPSATGLWRLNNFVEDKGPGEAELVPTDAQWSYFKGIEEPSATGLWRLNSFVEDGSWLTGSMAIGYDTKDPSYDLATDIDDMQNNYQSIYLRHSFEVANPTDIDSLKLDIYCDDGCIIWINGVEIVRGSNVPGGELPYDSTVGNHPAVWEVVTLSDISGLLQPGDNMLAVHALNRTVDSSDFVINVGLTGVDDGGVVEDPKPTSLRKCEIVPAWESDDITTFSNTIQVPASAIKPERTYRVRCKMQDDTLRWGHWSQPIEFVAGDAQAMPILNDLRITEVMYNPLVSGDYEFIELKNLGQQTLDLTGVTLDDGVIFDFTTLPATTLDPNEFILVVSNQAEFESRYGQSLNIAGEYEGNLSNGGENIRLQEFYNGTIVEFEYNDSRGWPQSADGAGHSLVPLAAALPEASDGSLDFPGNFRASTYINGSPGADDPVAPASIVINELAAHTDYSNPAHPEYDSNDWVELYNPIASTILLNGNWYLSDDFEDLRKWPLSVVQLNAGEFVSFNEVNDFHSPITTGFGLNKNGEQIILSYLPDTTEDRVVDYIHFKGQENLISLGRYPDGAQYTFAMTPTPQLANTAPLEHLVISEIMYHPLDDKDEYIELYNPTASAVTLDEAAGLWRIDSSVNFSFPPGLSITPDQRIVIVGFDPVVETARLDAFVAAYDTNALTPGIDIIGPWTGNLSNGGERIAIERPQEPDLPDTNISWIIVDEVIYGDYYPWPHSPDGQGDALRRISSVADNSGNDPTNWQGETPLLLQ